MDFSLSTLLRILEQNIEYSKRLSEYNDSIQTIKHLRDFKQVKFIKDYAHQFHTVDINKPKFVENSKYNYDWSILLKLLAASPITELDLEFQYSEKKVQFEILYSSDTDDFSTTRKLSEMYEQEIQGIIQENFIILCNEQGWIDSPGFEMVRNPESILMDRKERLSLWQKKVDNAKLKKLLIEID